MLRCLLSYSSNETWSLVEYTIYYLHRQTVLAVGGGDKLRVSTLLPKSLNRSIAASLTNPQNESNFLFSSPTFNVQINHSLFLTNLRFSMAKPNLRYLLPLLFAIVNLSASAPSPPPSQTCPLDFSHVTRIPWNTTDCQTYDR